MFSAFSKAIGQLSDPAFRKVMIKSLGMTIAAFIFIGIAVSYLFSLIPLTDWDWVNSIIEFVAGLGFVVGGLFVFPLFISALVGLFLDDIADAVEQKHYPADEAGHPASFLSGLWDSVKFLSVVILCNLLVLPLYLIPGVNLLVYYVLNGYLLSREYFTLVAVRHHPHDEAASLRKYSGPSLFLSGVGIAFFMTIPIVNLLAPIIATAAMVHLYKGRYHRAVQAG